MEGDETPLDDKAKRMRDLLSSFYAVDSSPFSPTNTTLDRAHSFNASPRYATLDTINTASFDADRYMNLLAQKSNLDSLLRRHFEMAAEIKNLDTDLQMLVYENYNKFISATDAIKRMKGNIAAMEVNMEHLLEKILCVQSKSDGVNNSLYGKRDHIEKMHRTRNLLRKVQFIYDLPTRLGKCIKSEAYADAVKLYIGAMPIFEAYGDSSFKDCKRASEQEVSVIIKILQGKVFADSESIQARAEAVKLLNQLNFPVDHLKDEVLEKLEQVLGDLNLECGEIAQFKDDSNESSKEEIIPVLSPKNSQWVSTSEFVEAVRAYKVIFPDSREQLIRLLKALILKHFEVTQRRINKRISSTDLLEMLRGIWTNVLMMDEILPEAAFPEFSLKAARVAIEHFITISFYRLLLNISEPLTKVQSRQKEGLEEEYSFEGALAASKKSVIQDSMSVLLDFRQLLEENLGLLLNLNKLIIEWVHQGFQDLFNKLDNHFRSLSGLNILAGGVTECTQSDKLLPGLVLVMAELSKFIEQIAIPRITEEIAVSFSESGARGYNSGPAFVSEEICRTFNSGSEKFLHLYIKMRMKKISAILWKRFTAPNWVKHKEPREVHMFVDLLFQELKIIGNEVKQILPQGPPHKHRHTDSNGSGSSSLSNSFNNDKMIKSTPHRTRSQLLETHLINLFKQKLEIFTKVEHTQESVYSTMVKLSLKSLHELVRLQTFNRSGFQQIQLDMQFLRSVLKETAEDEAAVNILLDEVIVAAGTRCLDPILLDSPVLDKLIQTKLAKIS
ncbi:vacuolar protein sorting-associated protein 51 homolog [Apium graveolens]|uniref:vacuolar protein sorting-associated protein 51 homolog n=1 Tax=Apium graveolens TaxID=4045 RepID=UPI003D78C6A3